MFRVPFLVAVILSVAFTGGIASTLRMLDASAGFGSIALGPWRAFPDAPTLDADPYARAHRALRGDLLLGGAEGLVFTADEDDDGQRLRGNCRYTVVGTTPPARFWTFHVADNLDKPLRGNPRLPHALHSSSVLRNSEGAFLLTVGEAAAAGNWVAMEHAGPVRFVLTLIDTPAAGSSGVVDLKMPQIRREACRDG